MSAALAMTNFEHISVLAREVAGVLGAPKLYVDCTLGGGGHARELLQATPSARLLGLDRDPAALAAAGRNLSGFGGRVELVHAPFSSLEAVLQERGLVGKVEALLADIGVSSHQLDTPERGFSFRTGGPLDMRMDTTRGETAAELIARLEEADLADVIYRYGEEHASRRIARVLKEVRPTTTDAAAAAVRRVVKKSKDGIDPATRTFQALRIAVNAELDELETLLAALPSVLADGGVAAIISFHSLEDRLVKLSFREAARDCICPSVLPACACGGGHATLEVLTGKPLVAQDDELAANPRSRSAKLRAARRLPRRPV